MKKEGHWSIMKALVLVFLAVWLSAIFTPLSAQERLQFPKDGNGLLDYCGNFVDLEDSKLSAAADEIKVGWCIGYVQASTAFIAHLKANLIVAAMAGVKLSGPEKSRPIVTNMADACTPERASTLQLARVLVKWLRDHPERLHEQADFLALDALKSAFPCGADAPTKELGTE